MKGIAQLRNSQKAPPTAAPPQEKIDEIMGLYEAKQHKEAMAKAEALVKVFPRFHGTYNIAGVILAEVGQWNNAIKAYHQALGLKPDFADAHYNYAIALDHLKRTDEAITSYRNAIKADPTYAEAYDSLGKCLRQKGMVDEAISCFRRAIEINPNLIKPHLVLGALTTYKVGDPAIDKLKFLLEDIKGDDESKAGLYFGLAKAYEDIGDVDTTIKYLRSGNTVRKEQGDYTTQMDRDLNEDIKSYFPSVDLSRFSAAP